MTEIKDLMTDKKVEPDYIEENGTKVFNILGPRVFKIHPDGSTTSEYRERYYNNRSDTNPRQTFPNLTVVDGEMRLPMSDIIDEIVSRASKEDLAHALLEDPDVRQNMIYGLSERYSYEGLDDKDRRLFIDKIKESIHSTALDKLVDTLHLLESAARNKAYSVHIKYDYGNHYQSVLDDIDLFYDSGVLLDGMSVSEWIKIRHGNPSMFNYMDKDYEIGGKHWNESRDFWRNKVIELFNVEDPTKEIAELIK